MSSTLTQIQLHLVVSEGSQGQTVLSPPLLKGPEHAEGLCLTPSESQACRNASHFTLSSTFIHQPTQQYIILRIIGIYAIPRLCATSYLDLTNCHLSVTIGGPARFVLHFGNSGLEGQIGFFHLAKQSNRIRMDRKERDIR